jgi:ATPase subunit of ABC transporter with duplicated ATPase domains
VRSGNGRVWEIKHGHYKYLVPGVREKISIYGWYMEDNGCQLSLFDGGEVIGNKSMFYIPQLKETGFENYSGGEYIRHYIELAKKENPEVLLLDEPTNHLDQEGREILQEYVNSFKGILIFVSHDVAFIKKNAKKILSLSDGNLENYTGSYEEYLEYKKLEKEGVERARSALKKEERKLKEALQIEHKRSQRTISNSKKEGYYDNDKFAKGFFKDHSQFAHGKIKGQIERLRESNKEKQDEHVLPEDLNVSFVFPASDSKRSLLIKLKSANLSIANRQLLADFDFEIYNWNKLKTAPSKRGTSFNRVRALAST